jgi:hypothetical protein
MRIENLRAETNGNKARVTATVIWEDCERPATEVYFATDEAFAKDLSCDPHAFLTACIMPALHHGEKRVFVDGEICPVLRDGLMTAMSWMRHWYDSPERELVRIEAKMRSNYPTPRTPERAGLFFSGGIDSLAALRTNRLNYPVTHPGSIKDCLLLYGQNIESDNRLETFEQAACSLGEVARDAGAMLIPVYTNVRSLEDDTTFFLHKFQAAILAAVAHALARRLTSVTLASDIHHCHESWGTHPLLDPNYSSSTLRIRHDSTVLSRLERTKLVADWDAALQNIKVCPPNWPGMNCGRCEKCVRTRLALLTLGVLDQTSAFPADEITAELVTSTVRIRTAYSERFYGELITALADIGRRDLARVLKDKIARYYDREPGWKGKIKRFDRKYLHGHLIRFKKAVYH